MDYRPFRRIRQPTTPLERGLFRLYQLVSPGALLVTICFIGYVVIGFSLSFVGIYEPAYSVMGFTDPFFYNLVISDWAFHQYDVGNARGAHAPA